MQNRIDIMKKGSSTILVIVLVVSALVLGVVFAYKYGALDNLGINPTKQSEDVQIVTEGTIEDRSDEITKLEDGDKVSDIEKDLNNTDVESIDKDVLGVKAEAEGL